MKHIFTGIATIAFASALIVGGTGAFFSDTESSVRNVFASGALDLKVDNESYYNGNKCANVSTDPLVEEWQWVGESPYPVPGTPCTTSWNLDDLGEGRLFFNFLDVKPEDEGEDTISLHIENDAWACMDLTVTSNDDSGSTEPELLVDEADEENDLWDGELAQTINMVWWADDGDNVLEEGEQIISGGVKNLLTLGYTNGSFSVVLADSASNAWGGAGPLRGEKVHYIAKAWCVGGLTENRVAQDDLGNTGQNGPMQRGTGILCDGASVGNGVQTDSTTLDIQFRAVQARHNESFTCEGPRTTLTIEKVVVGGNMSPADFQMTLGGEDVSQNVPLNVSPGEHTVSETFVAPQGYTMETSFSGVCVGTQEPQTGTATVVEGQNNVCTVTNTFRPVATTLEVRKVVAGTAPQGVTSADFQMTLDDGEGAENVDQNTPTPVDSAGTYTVGETYVVPQGYTMETTFSGACAEGGVVTLTPFVNNVCTVTNTFTALPATLTVNKVVVNNNGGNNVFTDFQLQVIGGGVTNVPHGVSNQFAPGNYTVTEVGVSGYVATFSGDCNSSGQVLLAPGDSKSCTITNTDLPAAVSLIKNVAGGDALPSQFVMRIDGNVVPQNTSYGVTSNSNHTISEDLATGYDFTSITGAGCPSALDEPFSLDEGESITCTITNTNTSIQN